MIRGEINERLELMVSVEIADGDGQYHPVEALLDTGFTQDLTLRPDAVARLGLKRVDRVPITLADGQEIRMPVYQGYVKWFGQHRRVEVIAMDEQPLLGMNFLAGSKVTFHTQTGGELLIEEIPQT